MKKLLLLFAFAAPHLLLADIVVRGTDYLSIQAGTQVTLAPFGMIDFVGVPFGPGNTSLTLERTADAQVNGAPAPLTVTAVSMQTVAPVLYNGGLFDLSMNLDPGHLGQNTGSISIANNGGPGGKTFTADLDVWVLIHAVSTTNPLLTMDLVREILLSSTAAPWSSTPPPGAVIVTGPHDGSAQDFAANLHTGLAGEETDFFATNGYQFTFTGSGGGTGTVNATPAVPEPGIWSLLLLPMAATLRSLRRGKHSQPGVDPR